MSSTPPTAGAYELELGILTLVLAAPVLALYLTNRDLYPIAQREPLMAFASNLGHTILVAVGLLEQVTPGMALFVKKIINAICFGVTLGALLLRIWKLYMDAGIAHERVTGKHGWFIAHRHYRSRSYLMRFVAVIFLLHAGVLTVQLANSQYNLENAKTAPVSGYDSILSATLIVLYFFSFAVFSVKLTGAKDGFYLKFEYRMVGLGSGFVCLVWLIKLIVKFDCAVSTCNSFILWFSWLSMITFSIVFPLTIAMRDRRFGVFRCFEKLKKAKERSSGNVSRGSLGTRSSTIGEHAIELDTPRTRARKLSTGTMTTLRQLPLVKFLTYPPGREAFRDFIVSEFSVENLLFVEAVQQFGGRQLSKEDVNTLIDQYITPSAPNQVNLPCVVVQRLAVRIKEGDQVFDASIFDDSVGHVTKLMQRDAYRRFQKTPAWHEHVATFLKETQAQPDIASLTTIPSEDASGDDTASEEAATRVSEMTPDPPTVRVSVQHVSTGTENKGDELPVAESTAVEKASYESVE